MTTSISVDEADDIHLEDHVAIQDVSDHRWYTTQLVVFERDPQLDLWGFYYLDPATEIQEGQDRYEADPVPIFPVSKREATITIYQPTK